MKRFWMIGSICGCLLIGSFYPRMILNHHMRLVDAAGRELELGEEYQKDIPVEFQFRFLRLFR